MKIYNKQPTLENVIQSIIKDDFGRNKTVMKFLQRINQIISCDQIENAFTISLDGDWGSGKTFFVKQVLLSMILKSNCVTPEFYSNININEETKKKLLETLEEAEKIVSLNDQRVLCNFKSISLPVIPIYYDAWKYDNSKEPVLSLINEIVNSINSIKGLYGKADLKEGVRGIIEGMLRTVSLSYAFNDKISVSVDGNGIADSLTAIKNFEKPDFLSMFSEEDAIHKSINELFEKLLGKDSDKIVIFIDELDRCKPSYAVTLLERIKHYFDNTNIVFVFSTNFKQLSNTVKNAYGELFDSDRYLDRFFEMKLTLPEIDLISYLNYLECNSGNKDLSVIIELFGQNNLSMREINLFWDNYYLSRPLRYRLDGYDPLGNKVAIAQIMTEFILPLIIVIKICRCSEYQDFINGDKSELFVSSFQNCMKELEYWFNINFLEAKPANTSIEEFLRQFLEQFYYVIFAPDKCNNKFINDYNLAMLLSAKQKISSVILECTSLISISNAVD